MTLSPEFGELSLGMTLLLAGWTVSAASIGGATQRADLVESAARALRAAALFAWLALAGLSWASVHADFGIRYVAAHVSEALPPAFRVSATWSGAGGALLLQCAVLASVAWLADLHAPTDASGHTRAMSAARAARLAVLGAAVAAVAAAVVVSANPFASLPTAPVDGRGLAPSLQSWPAAVDAPLAALALAAAGVWAALVAASVLASVLASKLASRRESVGSDVRLLRLAIVSGATATVLVALRAHGAYAVGGATLTPALLLRAHSGVGANLGGSVEAHAGADVGSGTPWMPALAIAGIVFAVCFGQRRRSGRLLAAIGVLMTLSALLASRAGSTTAATMRDGERMTLRDPFGATWTFTSQGASRIERPTYLATGVVLIASLGGDTPRFLATEVREYDARAAVDESPLAVRPAVQRTLRQDLRITVTQIAEGSAGIRIEFLPLAAFFWIGLVLIAVALPLATWPVVPRRA